jgi:hypothetical protein
VKLNNFISMRKTSIVIITILLALLSPALSMAENDYVEFAKLLTAKDYDDTLPPIPITNG